MAIQANGVQSTRASNELRERLLPRHPQGWEAVLFGMVVDSIQLARKTVGGGDRTGSVGDGGRAASAHSVCHDGIDWPHAGQHVPASVRSRSVGYPVQPQIGH